MAIEVRAALVRAGVTVIGPAPSLEKVLGLIDSVSLIDGAILDVNLGGELVFPAADLLRERGVPILFTTGYDRSIIPPRFDDVHRCEKPIAFDVLCRCLERILERGTGAAGADRPGTGAW